MSQSRIAEVHREDARDYLKTSNYLKAKKEYSIILKDWIPNDWEATIYKELCEFMSVNVDAKAYKLCDNVNNAVLISVNTICDSDMSLEEKIEAINFFKNDLMRTYRLGIFQVFSRNICYNLTREERSVARSKALSLFFDIGDVLDNKLSESKEINDICVEFWKLAIKESVDREGRYVSAEYCEQAKKHIPMVLKYDKSYIAPDIKVYVEKKPSKFKAFLSKIISFKDLRDD